ncbi:hypothetical protein HS088_TW11G00043 [Tripterygium wilfordii]|uniref:Uncharacterized protein n=1 Tax=Tripterygium wilfordii TaxID=458696 RepID=A0A7J7D0Y9_TRIWF|nr:hypothetical protein HS088_TW11G00043 [Tripterygium wilfordii]
MLSRPTTVFHVLLRVRHFCSSGDGYVHMEQEFSCLMGENSAQPKIVGKTNSIGKFSLKRFCSNMGNTSVFKIISWKCLQKARTVKYEIGNGTSPIVDSGVIGCSQTLKV